MIPIYRPSLPRESLRHAYEALDSGWVSSLGKYTQMVEGELARRLGVKHAIVVSNGTVAGHLMARCIRRFYPGVRRFIVPNNVFVAAWNSILYEWPSSALNPLDTNLATWNADYLEDPALEGANSADTCFLVVHNLGNTVNVPAVRRRFPKALVCEDACESAFGTYEGRAAGTAGFVSTLSFFSNKNISCGEGGAVLTDSDEAAAAVRLMKGQGQGSTRYLHEELGFNFRMTNVQAALLLGQLERWDEIKEKKRLLFNTYRSRLAGLPGVTFQESDADTEPSRWMFGIRVDGLQSYERAATIYAQEGVETRPMFFPIHRHGHLRGMSQHHKHAEQLHRECVILPSWPDLSPNEIETVARATERLCESVALNHV
jgi:perosamine synthetase